MSAPSSASEARAFRVMAVVRWALFGAVALVAATTWWTLVLHAEAPTTGEPRYYCPMHPEITSHDPGTCPVCFMTLEPIPDDLGASAAVDESATEPPPAPEVGSPPGGTAAVMLTTERRQASGITVAEVVRRELGGEVRWPAVVEALEGARAEVRVRAEAFVERVAVGESGVTVRRGQILAWVYSPEILRAEEELLAAHRWHAPGAGAEGSESAMDAAAARRLELLGVPEAEIAAVLASGETRRRVPLRAPISGVVTRFGATLGTFASPDTVLYEITDYERVRVVATVLAEGELSLAEHGTAVFERRGLASPVPLALEVIEPTLDESSRGTRARFVAANEDGALRPGDIGSVTVVAPSSSALFVPRDAVIDRGRVRYVFVETHPGLFEPRVVTVGALRDDDREIVAGLAPGERVVVRGGFVLDSESRLSAALAPSAAPDAGPSAGEGSGAHP